MEFIIITGTLSLFIVQSLKRDFVLYSHSWSTQNTPLYFRVSVECLGTVQIFDNEQKYLFHAMDVAELLGSITVYCSWKFKAE
jgi:hypothetical protein